MASSTAQLRVNTWEYTKERSALKYARKLVSEGAGEQSIEIHHDGRWSHLLTVTKVEELIVVRGPARWRFMNRELNEEAGLPDELDDQVVTKDDWEASVR